MAKTIHVFYVFTSQFLRYFAGSARRKSRDARPWRRTYGKERHLSAEVEAVEPRVLLSFFEPSAPTGLSAKATGVTSIAVDWNKIVGTGVNYRLFRSTSANGPWNSTTQVYYGPNNHYDSGSVLTANTTYYVAATASNSWDESSLSSIVAVKTLPDTTGPRIIAQTPKGPVQGPVGWIEVSFSEPIDPSTFTIADVHALGNSGPVSPVISSVTRIVGIVGNVYDIAFQTPLTKLGTYWIEIGPNITDLAGNPMDQNGDGSNGDVLHDQYLAAFTIENPNASAANPILTDGTPQNYGPLAVGDVDWVKFVLSAPEDVSIAANGNGVSNLTMKLYGPDDSTTVIADDKGLYPRINMSQSSMLDPGTYYVRISASEASRFSISVKASPSAFSSLTIQRSDGTSGFIDPTRTTWLVIHGMGSSPTNPAIKGLADAVDRFSPNDQVLTLDWSSRAGAQVAFDNIVPVAEWATRKLQSLGFVGPNLLNLNFIGHSYGCYVADETAKGLGVIQSIVALAPAAFDQDRTGAPQIDFAAHSRRSWAFALESGNGSSTITPKTATDSFVVENSNHASVINLFTNLIQWKTTGSSNDLGVFFDLNHLLRGEVGPWKPDQFAVDSNYSTGAPYEAVIVADSTLVNPVGIRYVDPATGFFETVSIDPVTGLVKTVGVDPADLVTIAGIDPATGLVKILLM